VSLCTQVSIDCILQLEEVIDFKSRMHVDGCVPPQSLRRCHPQQQQQHHHHPQQQQQQQQHHSQQQQGEGRYVTRLLDGVTREQVDAVVAWSAEDWSQQFESWCSQMPMLLDVISRALPTAPDQLTPAHVTVAQQRLEQVSVAPERGGACSLRLRCALLLPPAAGRWTRSHAAEPSHTTHAHRLLTTM
jgi:hypothetical protein